MTTAQRLQLNLRFDSQKELLEDIKDVAKRDKLSVNAWVVKTLESAIKNGARIVPPIAPEDLEATASRMIENLKGFEAQIIAATTSKTEPEEKATLETVNALRGELRMAYGQLARQDRELLLLYEQNRKLKLELSAIVPHPIAPQPIVAKPKVEKIPHPNSSRNDYHKRIQASVSIH